MERLALALVAAIAFPFAIAAAALALLAVHAGDEPALEAFAAAHRGSLAVLLAATLLPAAVLAVRARRRLRRVSQGYVDALAVAQSALATREEFLGIASHELKTPLTSLRLQLGNALRSIRATRASAPGHVVERLEVADRQAERLGHLIDGLLEASRAAAGGALRVEDVDLAGVAREEVARARELLARAGCEVTVSCAGPVVGRWDAQRLRQAVAQLLSNAAKYGRGRPVEVRVEGTGTMVRVSVRDHGIGIEPDRQLHIFERFGRGVSARNYGGFGLGLWVVRRVADALGGTVRVESAPGEGAVFTLELPRAEGPELPAAAAQRGAAEPPQRVARA